MTDSPDDFDAVRRLMLESGLEDDDALSPVLLELRELGHGPAPAPSAEVERLMTGGRRRRLGGRTGVVIALAVTASLAAGLTAAASPAVRETAAGAVAALGGPTVQRPDLPSVEAAPARSSGADQSDHASGTAARRSVPVHASTTPALPTKGRSAEHRDHGTRGARPSPAPSAGSEGRKTGHDGDSDSSGYSGYSASSGSSGSSGGRGSSSHDDGGGKPSSSGKGSNDSGSPEH
ncbi:MAG: hypothetical protein QOE37_1825 [Microbacteriaceae bacterium]|nr:hypothetical protein [Microbacteriaceae bacterium]